MLCPFDFKVRNYSHYKNNNTTSTDLCVVFHSAQWGTCYPLPTHRIIARNDFLLVHIFVITARARMKRRQPYETAHSDSDAIVIIIFIIIMSNCVVIGTKNFHMCDVCTHRPHSHGQLDSLLSLWSTIVHIDQWENPLTRNDWRKIW